MTRRDVIQKVLLGGTTLIVLPSVLSSCSKEEDPTDNGGNGGGGGGNTLTIDLANATYSALNNTGGTVVVQGIIIANTGNNAFKALTNSCTHEGNALAYNQAANNFICNTHGSVFTTTGAVVNGPALTAVKSHTVTKNGNILTIAL